MKGDSSCHTTNKKWREGYDRVFKKCKCGDKKDKCECEGNCHIERIKKTIGND